MHLEQPCSKANLPEVINAAIHRGLLQGIIDAFQTHGHMSANRSLAIQRVADPLILVNHSFNLFVGRTLPTSILDLG